MHRFSHEAMTTTFDALIVHEDAVYAEQAARAVFAEISRIERLISRFDPGTDIAQINRLRPGEYMAVNLEIVACLEVAAAAYHATFGVYDASYRSRQGGVRPSAMDFLLLSRPDDVLEEEATPENMQYLVGFAPEAAAEGYGQDMTIPVEAQTLEPNSGADPTPPDGLNIDLGGIGKGFALDAVQMIWDDWEIKNALLSAGTSTVLARGDGPEGHGWPVGVSGDFGAETGVDKVYLRDQGLSGSGTAVKGEHIRTPATGTAAGAVAAWALADSAGWTDAIATAAMAMTPAQAARFHDENPDTSLVVVYPASAPLVAGAWGQAEN